MYSVPAPQSPRGPSGRSIRAAAAAAALALLSGAAAITALPAWADEVAPTVTIDQGSGQADPSGTSPIVFDVVFSEPVTGFETGDVLLSGTADPTVGVVVPVSSTVYTVEVGGMSLSGTVIAAVPADVAADGTGEPERRVDVDG